VSLNLVSSKILDGNNGKAMPGSIPVPNSGSVSKRRKINIQVGSSKPYFINYYQEIKKKQSDVGKSV